MRAALYAVALIITSGTAMAQSPAYVGRWDMDAKTCRQEPGLSDSYARISPGRMKLYEYDCRLSNVVETGPGSWNAGGICDDGAKKHKESFALRVNKNRLTVVSRNASQDFVRCP